MNDPLPTIFVSIPSYRDSECEPTVAELFETARFPDRIKVGICWQFDPADGLRSHDPEAWYSSNVRVDSVPHDLTEGVCWARNRIQKMVNGQTFVLSIDSHTRFAAEWDQYLINEWKACESSRAVLTAYPWPFKGGDRPIAVPTACSNFGRSRRNRFPAPAMYPELNVMGGRAVMAANVTTDRPSRAALYSAGSAFFPSEMLEEVPIDPLMNYDSEELSYSIRLWTHGWDLFAPRHNVLFHISHGARPQGPHNFKTVQNHRDLGRRWDLSLRRFFHLLGVIHSSNSHTIRELNNYGIGHGRSLREFERFSGIYLEDQIASIRSYDRWFAMDSPDHPYRALPKPNFKILAQARYSNWVPGKTDDESTLSATAVLRKALPIAIRDLNAKTLLDIPCGDMTWMSRLRLPVDAYFGADIRRDVIAYCRKRFGKGRVFDVMDILDSPLPRCDVVLVRDLFTHFGFDAIARSIRNIKNSGSEYLIASHYPKQGENPGPRNRTGRWFPINLCLPPYSFPEPERIIDDMPIGVRPKMLGVWCVKDLPDLIARPMLTRSGSRLYSEIESLLSFDESEYLCARAYEREHKRDSGQLAYNPLEGSSSGDPIFTDLKERIERFTMSAGSISVVPLPPSFRVEWNGSLISSALIAPLLDRREDAVRWEIGNETRVLVLGSALMLSGHSELLTVRGDIVMACHRRLSPAATRALIWIPCGLPPDALRLVPRHP